MIIRFSGGVQFSLLFLLLAACSGGYSPAIEQTTPDDDMPWNNTERDTGPMISVATFIPTPTTTPVPLTLSTNNLEEIDELNRIGRGIINGFAVNPDGSLLAVASSIGVWLYDVESFEAVSFFQHDYKYVLSVAFSPNGDMVAAGTQDGSIQVWLLPEGQLISSFKAHPFQVSILEFSPNGYLLASASDYIHDDEYGVVKIWNIEAWNLFSELRGNSDEIVDIDFSPNEEMFAITSGDRYVSTIQLFDLKEIVTFRMNIKDSFGCVNQLSFSPDSTLLSANSSRGKQCFWRVQDGVVATGDIEMWTSDDIRMTGHLENNIKIHILENHFPSVNFLSFGSKQDIIRAYIDNVRYQYRNRYWYKDWYEREHFRFWDIESGEILKRQEIGGNWDDVESEDFESTVTSYTQVLLSDDKYIYLPTGTVAFPGGDGVVARMNRFRGNVEIYRLNDGQLLLSLVGVMGNITFSPDGQFLAVTSDGTLSLWTVDGKLVTRLGEETAWIGRVEFSLDGNILATTPGTDDGTIHLWSLNTNSLLYTLKGHTNTVESLSFSPDGQLLVSGSADKTVKIWDVKIGLMLQSLAGHSDEVTSVEFSPDGKLLASGSLDGTIILWGIDGTNH